MINNETNNKKRPLLWLQIALCGLGVLMIVGAITYSLINRYSASTSTTASTKSVLEIIPYDTDELNWVKTLRTNYESVDYIFIIMPGNDEITKKVYQNLRSVCDTIKQDGGAVDLMTLSASDPEFSATTESLAIQKLPAVFLLSRSGKRATIKGDITEEKLLQAYLNLQQVCVPGVSGCCPK
jgi:hypothetical protein